MHSGYLNAKRRIHTDGVTSVVTAIPVRRREAMTHEEFREACVRLPIQPAAAGRRLFVIILGLTDGRKHRMGEVEYLTADQWIDRLERVRTNRDEAALKIVRDERDERHIGVAWSTEGRAWQRRLRRWAELRDPQLDVAGAVRPED